MAAEEPYVCPFTPEVAKKAFDELHEDPKERESQVQAFRDWIKSQPHLKCRTDTRFLLMFLRGAKFSQLKAREMIDGNMTIHTKFPEWFQDIDTREPKLLDIIKVGYACPLPKKLPNGSKILLYRLGALSPDTKKMPVKYELRAGMVTGAAAAQDESIAVCGFTFIFDFSGATAKHMTRWSLDDMKKWTKAWQNNMPGRFKGFHYYNAGTLFEAMMAMMRPFLSKKFQDRIHVHDTVESLYKYIPMKYLPEDYLPDDYEGPSQGSVKDITDAFVKDIQQDEFRNIMLEFSSSKYGVDESKRVKDQGPAASFRKLNVD